MRSAGDDDLDRHFTDELAVPGLVDLAHTAGAEGARISYEESIDQFDERVLARPCAKVSTKSNPVPVDEPARGQECPLPAYWGTSSQQLTQPLEATDLRKQTTMLLGKLVDGDSGAAEEMLPTVYDALRGIARQLLADQRQATLQPTELIHEAYVRLVDDGGRGNAYEGRRHFQRVAARAMRYVLVDRARARQANKRGGGNRPATLDEALAGDPTDAEQVLVVHDALEVLGGFDPQLAQIVELRFFGGLTMEEVADALSISRRTAQRGWRLVRAWWIAEFAKEENE